jgi:hypothetical protein
VFGHFYQSVRTIPKGAKKNLDLKSSILQSLADAVFCVEPKTKRREKENKMATKARKATKATKAREEVRWSMKVCKHCGSPHIGFRPPALWRPALPARCLEYQVYMEEEMDRQIPGTPAELTARNGS